MRQLDSNAKLVKESQEIEIDDPNLSFFASITTFKFESYYVVRAAFRRKENKVFLVHRCTMRVSQPTEEMRSRCESVRRSVPVIW